MLRRQYFMSLARFDCWRPCSTLSSAIISINLPNAAAARLPDRYHSALQVAFHDVRDEAGKEPSFLPGPTLAIARQIVAFVDQLHQHPRPLDLIVHCHAGLSRSAAVAKFVQDTTGCPAASPDGSNLTAHNRALYDLLHKAANLQ